MAESKPRRGGDHVSADEGKRLVILAMHRQGLDVAEITRVTGVSRSWIKKLIDRERRPRPS